MARKRMLSPDFFTSGPVSALPVTAMITFCGLWCYLDDYGRGEDDAALIKATIWPRRRTHTEGKVVADLDAIDGQHLICRYTVGGVSFLHIPSWTEHQKISHPTPSRIPPCLTHEQAIFEFWANNSGDGMDRFRNGSGTTPEHLRKTSGQPP